MFHCSCASCAQIASNLHMLSMPRRVLMEHHGGGLWLASKDGGLQSGTNPIELSITRHQVVMFCTTHAQQLRMQAGCPNACPHPRSGGKEQACPTRQPYLCNKGMCPNHICHRCHKLTYLLQQISFQAAANMQNLNLSTCYGLIPFLFGFRQGSYFYPSPK